MQWCDLFSPHRNDVYLQSQGWHFLPCYKMDGCCSLPSSAQSVIDSALEERPLWVLQESECIKPSIFLIKPDSCWTFGRRRDCEGDLAVGVLKSPSSDAAKVEAFVTVAGRSCGFAKSAHLDESDIKIHSRLPAIFSRLL